MFPSPNMIFAEIVENMLIIRTADRELGDRKSIMNNCYHYSVGRGRIVNNIKMGFHNKSEYFIIFIAICVNFPINIHVVDCGSRFNIKYKKIFCHFELFALGNTSCNIDHHNQAFTIEANVRGNTTINTVHINNYYRIYACQHLILMNFSVGAVQ